MIRSGLVTSLFFKLNLWLCVTALLMVYATAQALGVPLADIGLGLVLPPLLAYYCYVEDRRRILPEDRLNHPSRTHLVEAYDTPLRVSGLLAVALYELLVYILAPTAPRGLLLYLGLAQVPLVVFAVYPRLKHVPPLDSFAVATVWGFTILYPVVLAATIPITEPVVAVFLAWLLIVFAGTEARNAEDTPGDTALDRYTLAAALGTRRTTMLEATLKIAGVLIFYLVAGLWVAGIVVLYLCMLWGFRALTRRLDIQSMDPTPGDSTG